MAGTGSTLNGGPAAATAVSPATGCAGCVGTPFEATEMAGADAGCFGIMLDGMIPAAATAVSPATGCAGCVGAPFDGTAVSVSCR